MLASESTGRSGGSVPAAAGAVGAAPGSAEEEGASSSAPGSASRDLAQTPSEDFASSLRFRDMLVNVCYCGAQFTALTVNCAIL